MNKNKSFIKPELEIVCFYNEDIILTSGNPLGIILDEIEGVPSYPED